MTYPVPFYSYWPFLKRDPLSSIKMNLQKVNDCPVFDSLDQALLDAASYSNSAILYINSYCTTLYFKDYVLSRAGL